MDNCNDHSMVLKRLDALEEGQKEVFARLIVVEKNGSKFEQAIEDIGNNISDIKTDIKEMKNEFKKLKELPSKRWENFKTIVITATVTATITGIIAYIFSKVLH